MSLFSCKILMSLGLLLITGLSGLYPFYAERRLPAKNFSTAEVFSCGIFLGVGLLHLLLDAIHDFHQQGYSALVAISITVGVVVVMLMIDKLQHRSSGDSISTSVIIMLMLSVHAFFDGSVVGLSEKLSVMYLVFFAIVVHKWAESFALAIILSEEERFKFTFRINTTL